VPRDHTAAFAPGRVNLIGEHTDYNHGLALPFAIAEGVTVRADARTGEQRELERVSAHALDLRERDDFTLADPQPAPGWRAFVRGTVAELTRAGFPLVGADLQIEGDLPRGAGLSSSAALEVALCLSLVELGSPAEPGHREPFDRSDIARLCSRVENDWAGARTGLLDQLASLYGASERALCIDFRSLHIHEVPLRLGHWRLVVLDSGQSHIHASSGYNQRRQECADACRLLGVASLRDAELAGIEDLPEPLRDRALHVLGENQRVREAIGALEADDLPALGRLLDDSHRSLRDLYDISTPAVEAAVQRLHDAGAAGARIVGGGFGGSVLGLFAPDAQPPPEALDVRPSAGARLLTG
jgi:galactokinase